MFKSVHTHPPLHHPRTLNVSCCLLSLRDLILQVAHSIKYQKGVNLCIKIVNITDLFLLLLFVLKALGESDLADVLKQFLSLMRSGRGTEAGSESGPTDFCVDELLLLLVYVYSLAQETQASGTQKEEKVEREIIGALTLLLTQQTTLSPLLLGITGTAVLMLQIGEDMLLI